MEDVKSNIEKLLTAVETSLQWANSSEDEITKNSLLNGIKSVRRSANTIKNSVKKRPSIAIFGQSQVGKSYLIQNLTKPEISRFLQISVSDAQEDVNFLTAMNPDGGRESTGLVTRFTTSTQDNDNDHPFKIEIFGQLDIAAILLNSYWSDLKDYDDDNGDLIEESKEILSTISSGVFQDISEDDTYFFCQYILENFKDVYLIKEFKKANLFNELQQKLHKIVPQQRWQILEMFWGKNKFITDLFKFLSDEIIRLQFQRELRINFNALSPNSTTILDVERIKELYSDNASQNVSVKLPNGNLLNCERSVISILTKEVQLCLANNFENDDQRSFLNFSDVLDFPGSKSREKIPLPVFNHNNTDQKLQLLVRGKVSYLFDIYTNHLGVSTLLYCMDDNPPEEKEAPHRLYRWVKKYVGENHTDREETIKRTLNVFSTEGIEVENISPLFVVLTKFNQELNKVIPGKETSIENHDSKWFARIQENFVNFMMRPVDDKWVNHWIGENTSFKHIFPVRDPMYSQATFAGYEIEQKETEIRPERVEAMKSMKVSFLGSDIVSKHLIDPKNTWSEISSPNGSGIMNLSKHLNYSANPIVTKAKLEIELEKISKELLSIIKPHLISGDINKDLLLAKAESAKSFTALVSLANKSDNLLSKLLSGLIISDTELWNVLYDYIFINEETEEETNIEETELSSLKDIGLDIYEGISFEDVMTQLRAIYSGLSDDEIKTILKDYIEVDLKTLVSNLSRTKKKNMTNRLADLIISFWMEKLIINTIENDSLNKLTELQKESFRVIVNEIIKSREKFGLADKLSKTINDIKQGAVSSEDMDLVASCATAILNKFTFSAGWNFCEEDLKPTIEKTGNKIFSSNGLTKEINQLDFKKDKSTKRFFNDWSNGIKMIFEENVKHEYGFQKSFNSARNQQLESIIANLEN
jgi:hypothetical protein